MDRAYYLDSTPLGLLSSRRSQSVQVIAFRHRIDAVIAEGNLIFVPAIVEYEIKRELIRAEKVASLRELKTFMDLHPFRRLGLSQAALDHAAGLWAKRRQVGRPTAPPEALDVDVLLASQVLMHQPAGLTKLVVTSNLSHLAPLVPCIDWEAL